MNQPNLRSSKSNLVLLLIFLLTVIFFRTLFAGEAAQVAEFAETKTVVPKLPAAGVYELKNNTVEMELSEYAGYAGVIVANCGLAANENSVFFKKYGFKLNITLSEEESRPQLNAGKLAALATTADVLPVYGSQFQVVVPLLISYSRGGDGVVVRNDIKGINALKGKTLVCAQFTESDFLIRYLAQEAGFGINMLKTVKDNPDPAKLNLVFTADAFGAGDIFLADVKSGKNLLAGCVTWDPKTTEVATQSGGKAHILFTNRNLLLVADILTVNKGFAKQHPDILAGLVGGWLEGNRMIRDNTGADTEPVLKAFKWDRAKYNTEMTKVHLANGPENLAFFSGAIDAAGSYGYIYESAVYAYGKQLIKDPPEGEWFLNLSGLKTLEKQGRFEGQKVAILPIATETKQIKEVVEGEPTLSKDIRFFFEKNTASLDLKNAENMKMLEQTKRFLQVGPGSVLLLVGHVDDSQRSDFERKGLGRQASLAAKELSHKRAEEIKRVLVQQCNADGERIETQGKGWDQPTGAEAEKNRRVEVKWFVVE